MTTTWDPLRLEHIGRDADDATSLLDEANARIGEAARHVSDLKNGERATVTIKLDVRRTGADGTVLVQGAVVTRLPARERLGVTGLLADGELVTQAHRQLDVQDVLRAARETAAEVEQAERPARRRPEPAWRRKAPIEAAESAEGGEG